MPSITCKECGKPTMVLFRLALPRHCSSCGAVLVTPLSDSRQLADRAREAGATLSRQRTDRFSRNPRKRTPTAPVAGH